MRVALRTVFGVTPRTRNRFLGWRLTRGVTPKNAKRHAVTPTPARSHPENGGMAPHQFFENNYFSEANQLRVLTVHEGHMGHYHHWRTDDSSSSCFCAIVNVGKMRGVTPTDAMYRKITSHWHGSHFSLRKRRRRPHIPTKLVAVASFSYKIGGGGKDLATLLAAVLTWSGYWQILWSSTYLSKFYVFTKIGKPVV